MKHRSFTDRLPALQQKRHIGLSRQMQRGLTLVELMVTVSIAGLILALGVRSFSSWSVRSKVNNAAEFYQNALRLAKTEAVKRNTRVDVTWTTQAPTAAIAAAGVTASITGQNWIVQINPAYNGNAASSSNFIQGHLGTAGSANVTWTAVPNTFLGTVTFDSWGRVITPTTGLTLKFTPVGAATPEFDVRVSTGGKIVMCNPLLPAGDPQGCV